MTHTAPIPAGLEHEQMILQGEQATGALAQSIAQHIRQQPDLRIYLYGDLGAGKTTFVRLLLRALGVEGRIKSPTYALIESYDLPELAAPACHFDLYRLEHPQEWQESGLAEELIAPGLRLVEWPQKAAPLLPGADISLSLSRSFNPDDEETRILDLVSHSAAGQALLRHVQESVQ